MDLQVLRMASSELRKLDGLKGLVPLGVRTSALEPIGREPPLAQGREARSKAGDAPICLPLVTW